MCCGVNFFGFIQFGVCLASGINKFMPFVKFGAFSLSFFFFKACILSHLLSAQRYSHDMNVGLFVTVPRSLRRCFLFQCIRSLLFRLALSVLSSRLLILSSVLSTLLFSSSTMHLFIQLSYLSSLQFPCVSSYIFFFFAEIFHFSCVF